MNGITVSMALVDFIPVVLFFIAAIYLQRDLYNKMVKGAYALLAAGSIMVLVGGLFKATWKILYALNICDYQILNQSLFPFQTTGFLLVFLSLVGMYSKYNKTKFNSSTKLGMIIGTDIVLPYASNLPFVIVQVIACAGMQTMLFITSIKMKKVVAAILFVVSFISMLAMGYLSSKFDNTSNMNWIAQCTNIVSQGSLLGGVIILHKSGLGDEKLLGLMK